MKHGKIIIFSGPSRAGKDAVLSQLSEKARHLFTKVVTCTTRPRRPSEQDGVDYHFLSKREFQRMIKSGELLEWATFSAHCYGTPKAAVLSALRKGKNVLLKIEVEGGVQVKHQYPKKTVSIFLEPGNLDDLKRRWKQGHFSAAQQRLRLARAQEELRHKEHYDHSIKNVEGALDATVSAMEKLLRQILTQSR